MSIVNREISLHIQRIFHHTVQYTSQILLALGALAALAPAPVSAQSAAVAPAATPAALELVVLGSGGPGAVGRAGSSFAVLLDGKARILVDAGPGAFVRAGEEKLLLRDLDIVLLTHLHADHTSELPGMVKARAVSVGNPIKFRVFGPGAGVARYPSTSRFMELLFGEQGAFAYLADFSAPVSFETVDVAPGADKAAAKVILEENGLRISAAAGHHRDAPAVVYRIDYHGRSMTFSGDIDAAGLPALRSLAKASDVLVFNSVVLDPPGSPAQLYALHTPPQAIGELAQAAGAGQLLLNHLTPAIDKAHDAVLASIRKTFAGPVIFSQDRLHLRF
jgi:ribonuclease BN (tRNA processing enzyme)